MQRSRRESVIRFDLFLAGLLAGLVGYFALQASHGDEQTGRTRGAADSLAARVATLETEVAAARSNRLYLTLDAAAGRVELSCRDVVLWSRPAEIEVRHDAGWLRDAKHPDRLVAKRNGAAAPRTSVSEDAAPATSVEPLLAPSESQGARQDVSTGQDFSSGLDFSARQGSRPRQDLSARQDPRASRDSSASQDPVTSRNAVKRRDPITSGEPIGATSGAEYATLDFERSLVHLEIGARPALPTQEGPEATWLRQLRNRLWRYHASGESPIFASNSRTEISAALSPADVRALAQSLGPGTLLVVRGL